MAKNGIKRLVRRAHEAKEIIKVAKEASSPRMTYKPIDIYEERVRHGEGPKSKKEKEFMGGLMISQNMKKKGQIKRESKKRK